MVFSLRQLQEKCREQRQPLYIGFIDLTKAFDLVRRDGLFKILPKIGCPPRLLSIIKSVHKNMKGTVVFDGSTSDTFKIKNGVKQGCVLAPTLFGIYLRTRVDGKLFNLSRLKAKTKTQPKHLRDFLFADDATVTTRSAEDLQQLMTPFNNACRDFGLTISLKKTRHGTGRRRSPRYQNLGARVGALSEHTKILIYSACVVSTLLYGSESLRARQEQKLKTFYMQCLCRILNITWQDKITNNTVLERAQTTSMHTLLKQRRLRWLGHVVRMEDRRIPKDLLYGELGQGKRPKGRLQLRHKDVCKRDLKALNIDEHLGTVSLRPICLEVYKKKGQQLSFRPQPQEKEIRLNLARAARSQVLPGDANANPARLSLLNLSGLLRRRGQALKQLVYGQLIRLYYIT
ncbi:uncharacterized protein [Penaeus vannamei]|uniref:uncharacterized protein n=1 Tax=Penaeus vannamei TaxID=6689 RepID=UPI00387F426F